MLVWVCESQCVQKQTVCTHCRFRSYNYGLSEAYGGITAAGLTGDLLRLGSSAGPADGLNAAGLISLNPRNMSTPIRTAILKHRHNRSLNNYNMCPLRRRLSAVTNARMRAQDSAHAIPDSARIPRLSRLWSLDSKQDILPVLEAAKKLLKAEPRANTYAGLVPLLGGHRGLPDR